jgi:hypothetical protein
MKSLTELIVSEMAIILITIFFIAIVFEKEAEHFQSI